MKTGQRRKDKIVKPHRKDTYQPYEKLPDPTVCRRCGAVFIEGRWTWKEAPASAGKTTCPACLRIEQRVPAGVLEIKGPFYRIHHDEIGNLIRHVEEMEKGRHPLERIISVAGNGERTTITTTGIHLARRLGEALYAAYQGDYVLKYGAGEKSVRVYWER